MEEKNDKLRLPCIEDYDSPWLIYTHGCSKRKQIQTFCKISGISNTISNLKSIPQLRQKSILASIHGWLILRELDILSIFNPFTLYSIVLPPLLALDENNDNIKCSLKSTPDCLDCVLVVCLTEANIMFSCCPAQPNCCWITHPFHLQGSNSSVSEIITVNGSMYVFTSDRLPEKLFYRVDDFSSFLNLRPFDFRAPDSLPILNLGKQYMVESCNQVYLVLVGSYYIEQLDLEYVKVLELDIDGCMWREIESLGGRSFFLGHECSSTWCWGTTDDSESQGGIQRNCIYFYHSFAPPHPVHIYNLIDGSLMPIRPCPDLLSSKCEYPVWIIPNHLRLEKGIKKGNINNKQGVKDSRMEYNDHELSQNKHIQESRLSEIPLHLVEKISKHMNPFDYWNFRATSTIFQSIFPAPRLQSNNELPLFLFFNNARSCNLMDPSRHGSLSHVPFFVDYFTIRYSKNGWILAMIGKSLQYFNIFTETRGEYPLEGDLYYCFSTVAFSTYPMCSKCLTIGTFESDVSTAIFYHEFGKETWNHCVLEFEDEFSFEFSNCCPIFLAGSFYILDKKGYLIVFQLVNGEASWRMYPRPQTLMKFYASHLVDSEGELYSVFIERMGQWVQVFRFDNLMKCWVEVEYLENQVFFVSRASSFSIVNREHKMRNRIYLPRLYKKGLVYYSQDTTNYHSLASNDIIKDFYRTSEPLRCCWI